MTDEERRALRERLRAAFDEAMRVGYYQGLPRRPRWTYYTDPLEGLLEQLRARLKAKEPK